MGLRSLFEKYASLKGPSGEPLMTEDDFLRSVTRGTNINISPEVLRVLVRLADEDRSGVIDFSEFVVFHSMMNTPEAEFKMAFKLFDANNDGSVSLEDFRTVMDAQSQPTTGFDYSTEFVRLFFGKEGKNRLTYSEFCEFLKVLKFEMARQAFERLEKGRGFVSSGEFFEIAKSLYGDKFSTEASESRVKAAVDMASVNGKVSYAHFLAFENCMQNLDAVVSALRLEDPSGTTGLNMKDFVRAVSKHTDLIVSPLEAAILFGMFDVNHRGRLAAADVQSVLGKRSSMPSDKFSGAFKPDIPQQQQQQQQQQHTEGGEHRKTVLQKIVEFVENFALGAVAGAVGAFTVFPIDTVKTRLQNQRSLKASPTDSVLRYTGPVDCARKILAHEGIQGFYRGLVPQLVGVAPEKAIKLAVNDLLRGWFSKNDGKISLPLEILAGGAAGASQTLFTNPLEIVKIRLQIQGEYLREHPQAVRHSASDMIKELGFFGLYKGNSACLLRDIPFSAIYFPAYAKTKAWMTQRNNGVLGSKELLLSGAIAGVPAAWLCTPADVIKTRIQAERRTGVQMYTGLADCATKIWQQEGYRAFFKGGLLRVFRSSPQFGVTLLSYEVLHKLLAPDLKPLPPTNVPVSSEDFLATFRGEAAEARIKMLEHRFGLSVSTRPSGTAPSPPLSSASASASSTSSALTLASSTSASDHPVGGQS